MEEEKNESTFIAKEINSQKPDFIYSYRSNSQSHYQDIIPYNYEHRIRLNPSGESTTMDIRNHIPIFHINKTIIKSEISPIKNKKKKTAYEKAEIEEKINTHLNKQKHQDLLKNNLSIRNKLHKVNEFKKKKLENKKLLLKRELTRIIKDALLFSKKNNAVRAMLPDNINEIVASVKKETQDLSITLNLSRVSRISRVSSLGISTLEKNDFLNSLGVDMENFNENNVNIDIDKCWDYVVKIAKGKNIEDIMRYKVVNIIMNLVEKKSAEKARKIYEKLAIYKKYMEGKKKIEIRRKKIEKEKKDKELKGNIKEYIKQKMYKSLSEKKIFQTGNDIGKNNKKVIAGKKSKKGNKQKRAESAKQIYADKIKKLKRMNAYRDVNKIIKFIDTSKKNSQSKYYRNHYESIQTKKDMDKTLEKLIEKNDIFK